MLLWALVLEALNRLSIFQNLRQ